MTDQPFNWDDVRRIADEVELEIHLAGMEARERWRTLQPRLAEIGKTISKAGKRAGEVAETELSSIGAALRRLRDDIKKTPAD